MIIILHIIFCSGYTLKFPSRRTESNTKYASQLQKIMTQFSQNEATHGHYLLRMNDALFKRNSTHDVLANLIESNQDIRAMTILGLFSTAHAVPKAQLRVAIS
jgi:hypothetical protein